LKVAAIEMKGGRNEGRNGGGRNEVRSYRYHVCCQEEKKKTANAVKAATRGSKGESYTYPNLISRAFGSNLWRPFCARH
jgi:hypothetical protein